MTIDTINLQAPVENACDADFLREMNEAISNQLMEIEIDSLTGVGHGERSLSRINRRNGYRERASETRVGTVVLAIPKLRKDSYFPAFLVIRWFFFPSEPRARNRASLGINQCPLASESRLTWTVAQCSR